MARFVVPKFIERETRIIGPLTFKQFAFIAFAGVIAFVLYFLLPFFIFLIIALFLLGGALGLAFVNIGPYPMPAFLKNFFAFFTSSRLYIWKKGIVPPKIIEKPKPKEIKPIKKGPELKIAEKSQLKKLSTQIETGTK